MQCVLSIGSQYPFLGICNISRTGLPLENYIALYSYWRNMAQSYRLNSVPRHPYS